VVDWLLAALPASVDVPAERSYAGALRRLSRAADMPQGASVIRWGSYFDESEKRELFRPEVLAGFEVVPSFERLDRDFRAAPARTRVDRTLYVDLLNYLPGALLVKADRMTMAHSLEARSPLLDQKLLELAARLPVRYKVSRNRTKRVLRAAFADMLPAALAARPKMGFGVPLAAWFRGPLHDAAHDLLLGPDARVRDYLRAEPIGNLLSQNRAGAADFGKRIWALLNLEVWLRQYAA
jgi:asparagine synthase (glutamine-hydrolysing)